LVFRPPARNVRIILLAVLLSGCSIARASSVVLLRLLSQLDPELSAVKTYAGVAVPSSFAVKLGSPVTIVLLTDTLSPAEVENAKSSLMAFYTSLRGRPLRIALLRNTTLAVAGPIASRVALKSTLDEVQSTGDPSATSSPSAILDALSATASQLGTDWSSVLLIGNFPALDPATLEYASAVLVRAFGTQHLQVSWFAPDRGNDAWLPVFQSTGGTIFRGSLNDLSASIQQDSSQSFLQIDWTPAAPTAGFILFRSVITDHEGHMLLEVPDIAAADGTIFPPVGLYSEIRAKAAEAAALLGQEPINEADSRRLRDDIATSLEANPRDGGALLTAAAFYEKLNDYSTAARLRASLTEVNPLASGSYAALGHDLVLSSEIDRAEVALKRAAELGALTPQASEDFAHILLARNDDQGALPYLDQALRADAKRQDLWFLQARAAERLRDSKLAIRSYEEALGLGGVHIPENTSLIRLYLASQEDGKAQELIGRVIANFPPEPGLRAQFAQTLDSLRQPNDALIAWKRVLEVQPDSTEAHDRVARLLFESGDASGAVQAADRGLSVAPKFADLYIVKADALEKQGQMYHAHSALKEGAAAAQDPVLLSRLASTEDSYGASAADAYARSAESLSASSPERLRMIERGFDVAMRDGNLKQAQAFAAALQSAGRPEFLGLLGAESRAGSTTVVPGGRDALSFAAHMKEGIPPDRFFAEYARTLIDQIGTHPDANSHLYTDAIEEHFQRIAALAEFGKRDGNRVVITLALNGKDARRHTEKVLSALGITLRVSKGKVELDRGESKSKARQQETLSALAVDELGIQTALQDGKSYTLEIPYESVPIYPNEKLWREAFYANDKDPGGFATALLRMPAMARLYVGLSLLDTKSVSALLSAVNIKGLYDNYGDLLFLYAPALALQGAHAAVPGGPNAESIWARLLGGRPDQPGAFFRALLDRDDGRLLAFFSTLSELDSPHQAFFTNNLSRTTQFYKLFTSAGLGQRGLFTQRLDSTFAEVLRSVPLDSTGHVDFPGSAEVWTVAEGHSSTEQARKLLKRVSKAVAPEVEDVILLRLAQTRYNDKAARHTELDNFLAVSRINAHRSKPLDEEAALLLAQRYSDSLGAYAYFTDLTALEAADFRSFFTAVDRIRSHSAIDANVQLGQLHALIELLCLLNRRQAITDDEAAKLFRYVCEHFSSASDDAAYTSASLDSVRSILSYCQREEKEASPDDKIRSCLLGLRGESGSRRAIEFQQVLDAQAIPSLTDLFSIYDGTAKLLAGIASIQKGATGLHSVALPKGTKITEKEKDFVLRYDPTPVGRVVGQLVQQASKSRVNRKEVEKLCTELLANLEPQVTAALAGPIYAYFLRPSDLVVSDDSLLVRKHRYFDFSNPQAQMNPESDFRPESQGSGSYFVGGFATFGLSAGSAAGARWRTGSPAATAVIGAEIGAIRSANWDRLEESDQRLLGLRVEVAREWVFESARFPEALRGLSEETMGLLSPTRRSDLLSGIEAKDWREVWDSITLPDLFALGGRYLDRFKTDPWSSPVTSALRSAAAVNDGSRLRTLGAITYRSFGCAHPDLLHDAPYEVYERHLLPDDMAERSAEFKLFLAFRADSIGVEPTALADVAETLAAKAFLAARMTDFGDWRSQLAAYGSITSGDLEQALNK
jgi:predicted Zn-dependent protease